MPPPPPPPPSTAAASGRKVPVPVKPVASGTYQSLSSTFGDDGPPTKRDSSSFSSSVAATSVSSPDASQLTTGSSRSRSDSIDRLTGRVPLPSSNGTPLKVGWLKREGDGLLGGFKKRWCVVHQKTLEVFKELNDEKSQSTIILPGAAIFLEGQTDFHIVPIRSTKKVSFRCESEFDRNSWVKLLQELSAIEESLLQRVFDADSYVDWSSSDIQNLLLPSLTRLLANVGTMSSIWGVGDSMNVGVLISGFLTKMGEKVKNFKRRYFVLVGSILLYFDSEESYMLTDAGGATGPASSPSSSSTSASSAASSSSSSSTVVGNGAPAAPPISSSKGSHGKEVLASLTRTHLRAQRRSITPVDLQNHHLIRRGSNAAGTLSGKHSSLSAAANAAAEEEKRKKDLQKKVLKGESKSALGMIPLTDCTLDLEPTHSRPFGFSLQTRDRRYYLFADNEDEMRAWVYMLNLIIHSLPIHNYMKRSLEATHATPSPTLNPQLSSDDLYLLKKQLIVTLLDPTCLRFLQNYWLERQSFHEPRTYPYLMPLESPLTLLTESGSKFFNNLLVDEAGERGENHIHLPYHYLQFWIDCENWMNLRPPTKMEGGDEPNPYATAQDPSCIESCIPLAQSYRQERCEELIDKYLAHGAPYPVYLEQHMREEIMSASLRGINAPNKIAPSQELFQKAQELITEMMAVEVFPRYLRSKSTHWSYLSSIAAKYDETLIYLRAETVMPELMARAYEPDVYEELTDEEKEEEEDERIQRFCNLVSTSPDQLDAIALESAEQFGRLPNTDPTKMIYHNYLYALQRLREYHALFSPGAATPGPNQPPIALTYRQTRAASEFYHDFLLPGSQWALCVPFKLIRHIRSLLSSPSPRRQFLFMDVEHIILTELRFGCAEAKAKIQRQVENQKAPLKKKLSSHALNPLGGVPASSSSSSSTGADSNRAATPRSSSVSSRASVIFTSGQPPLPSVDETAPMTPAQAATYQAPMTAAVEGDVPFNMVIGVSALFSHFRRFTLTCRHINPQYLWAQVSLISRIFDYRLLADPKVMVAYARQVYSQYLSEDAPNKISITKSTLDVVKVGVSQQSPGPHVFLPILKELYQSLHHLYSSTFKSHEAYQIAYSYLQEECGLFIQNEISVTQGRQHFNFDANINLMTSNKNAATWFDILEFNGSSKELDETLANLSSHQALWTAYFRQFLTERSAE